MLQIWYPRFWASMLFSIYISLSTLCLWEGKWHAPRCGFVFSPSFCYQAGATEITQTLLIPYNEVSSISILGVASDGMTTFVYFEPDPENSMTFKGMGLPS
jgi:hypothetical protein